MNEPIINQIKQISHFVRVSPRHIRRLQKILKSSDTSDVSYKDAEEVARELINFYECLADNRPITRERLDE